MYMYMDYNCIENSTCTCIYKIVHVYVYGL